MSKAIDEIWLGGSANEERAVGPVKEEVISEVERDTENVRESNSVAITVVETVVNPAGDQFAAVLGEQFGYNAVDEIKSK
ncbi:hypothetical protein ALC56_00572 [Trachymyrmex septentrionalis]|uniref:Uncharacterized protein n=1 Tax=Trachymyrmex septentrionalis TaxID=34720 RepID=A0A195FW81_9HYME|nr:hypothetical protein ALC56_00572 [Trachymyrmex septentrionalis]